VLVISAREKVKPHNGETTQDCTKRGFQRLRKACSNAPTTRVPKSQKQQRRDSTDA